MRAERALVYIRDKVVVIEYYNKELNENEKVEVFMFNRLNVFKDASGYTLLIFRGKGYYVREVKEVKFYYE